MFKTAKAVVLGAKKYYGIVKGVPAGLSEKTVAAKLKEYEGLCDRMLKHKLSAKDDVKRCALAAALGVEPEPAPQEEQGDAPGEAAAKALGLRTCRNHGSRSKKGQICPCGNLYT